MYMDHRRPAGQTDDLPGLERVAERASHEGFASCSRRPAEQLVTGCCWEKQQLPGRAPLGPLDGRSSNFGCLGGASVRKANGWPCSSESGGQKSIRGGGPEGRRGEAA